MSPNNISWTNLMWKVYIYIGLRNLDHLGTNVIKAVLKADIIGKTKNAVPSTTTILTLITKFKWNFNKKSSQNYNNFSEHLTCVVNLPLYSCLDKNKRLNYLLLTRSMGMCGQGNGLHNSI